MQMLCKIQQAIIVSGILSLSSSYRLCRILYLPFVKPYLCSETILAFDNSSLNFFCSWLSAPLSLKGQSSHGFNGYAESPTIRGRTIVPLTSTVGSVKIKSFSAASNI